MKREFLSLLAALVLAPGMAAAQSKARLIPGTALSNGLGQFGDASSFHGLVVGLQAGLGTRSRSFTFGHSNTVLSAQYSPGDETQFGGLFRISFMAGMAEWYAPGAASIYPVEALTEAERGVSSSSEDGSSSERAVIAGLSLGFGNRGSETDLTEDEQQLLMDLDLKLKGTEPGTVENDELLAARRRVVWRSIQRVIRKPVAKVGAFTRLDTLATGSNVEAIDAFAAGAWGRGMVDFSASMHFLYYLDSTTVASHAFSGSVGAFIDLGSLPPVPVLGLTAGLGRYQFRSRSFSVDDVTQTVDPASTRLDLILSLSGMPDLNSSHSAGVGFRFSREWRPTGGVENQLVFLMTSNFRIPVGGN